MGLSIKTINTGLGIRTNYYDADFTKIGKVAKQAVQEISSRQGKSGQFLNWVELPEQQLKRVDYIYDTVRQIKSQTPAKFLSVIGIGGSKHPVEHMLGINGLNLDKSVKFMSDIDTVSNNRFLRTIGDDVTNSNFLVVSKSGSTFEPKDALVRFKEMVTSAYKGKGASAEEAQKLTSKHFVAVTDKSNATSELRRTAISENWAGDLFIHDDVGGRFSAFDDHTLFTLAYAGMKKKDMIAMLNGAKDMTKIALSPDLAKNDPLAQAMFWVNAKKNGTNTSVHQYLGSMFEDTVNWHSQMQNESIKTTTKQITKVPDAMHHSAEAHFNDANRFAFALTSPEAKGLLKENVNGYVGALNKSYANVGPHFNEVVEVGELGLTPQSAGALTQSRAFSTVYQEPIENILENKPQPSVLKGVLQPFVEVYKKNLKPEVGKPDVVVAGRVQNKP